MKKNLRNFCNGVDSTSTVNQHRADRDLSCVADPSFLGSNSPASHPTLEEMILQLELEEEAARRPKLWDYGRRTSCVNNSDVLRSARSALNQYPRFSLDGRDAMYRSSFRNLGFEGGRKSVCSSAGHMGRLCRDVYGDLARSVALPSVLAGESVVWCKPGVVAKLMGLEAMPMPINKRQRSNERFSYKVKKDSNIRMFERCELEKGRLLTASMQRCRGKGKESSGLRRRSDVGSRVMEAVAMEAVKRRDSWRAGPTR